MAKAARAAIADDENLDNAGKQALRRAAGRVSLQRLPLSGLDANHTVPPMCIEESSVVSPQQDLVKRFLCRVLLRFRTVKPLRRLNGNGVVKCREPPPGRFQASVNGVSESQSLSFICAGSHQGGAAQPGGSSPRIRPQQPRAVVLVNTRHGHKTTHTPIRRRLRHSGSFRPVSLPPFRGASYLLSVLPSVRIPVVMRRARGPTSPPSPFRLRPPSRILCLILLTLPPGRRTHGEEEGVR